MTQLATVHGGESLGDVLRALPGALSVPVSGTYDATTKFIADHQFFHRGVMDAPIGGGKHFRNVAFIGPTVSAAGWLTGNADRVAKGHEITRATHDAP